MTAGQYKAERDPRGYTPTTEDVRDEWRYNIQEVDIDGYVVVSFDEAGAQFDRMIAQVRAEALREFADRYQDEADWRTPADIDPDLIREVADRIEKGADRG